jgi:NIMA (never in mitosis gene a)-related kinase
MHKIGHSNQALNQRTRSKTVGMSFSKKIFRKKKHITPVPETPDPAIHFPEQHTFNRQLQKGSEGYVQQWTHKPSRAIIAVKVIKRRPAIPNEVEILQDLPPHPSIIQYLGYYDAQPSPNESSILLEYCPQGDMFFVRNRSYDTKVDPFSEAFMWAVYSQLVQALAFLHEGVDFQNPMGRDYWKPIAHRDIKVENVMVKSLGSKADWSDIELKLGDFGAAGYHDASNPNPRGYFGTPYNWPPEVTLENLCLSPESDVWGVAAIIHELAHGFGPIMNPSLTGRKWYADHHAEITSGNVKLRTDMDYFAAISPRRVVPINLEPNQTIPALEDPSFGCDEQAICIRKRRPSPKYSEELNGCMMAGLTMLSEERPGSGKLHRRVEGAHAEFLFRELSFEHAREMSQNINGNNSDEDEESLH